ncbi:MAG: excinuclease ABC subunit UvrC [Lentihominibacter sp.]
MFDIQENLKKLPDCPGVYMHKDRLGNIIYVGKAVSLKNRVRQYFQSKRNMPPKVRSMVENIAEFEYITAGSEMEALILECNLIKKYRPKYNVLLRDDKTYPYIRITNEDYPRILKTRMVKKDGSRYYGPYSDAGAVNKIVDLLNSSFALKRCSATDFPPDFRPCLNFHINQCRGICSGEVSRQEYADAVEGAREFLNGKNRKIISMLEEKMYAASEAMEYEEAAKYRDYIEAAEALSATQRVVMHQSKDIDIVIPAKGTEETHMVVFFVREGKLTGRETYEMDAMPGSDKSELVSAFINQHYSRLPNFPREILLTVMPEDKDVLEQYLADIAGHNVKLMKPQKGEKKALVDMASRDVLEMVKTIDRRAETARERRHELGNEIFDVLKRMEAVSGEYDDREFRVEAYDISNTNGVDTVGAMVVFDGLRADKKSYRKFKVRTVAGQDDYGSMREILSRRFSRVYSGDEGFEILPDIILMDGGKGHVSTAVEVAEASGFDIPVVGMVKDDKHRTRALVFRKCGCEEFEEIPLQGRSLLFRYIGRIQEEVHRFAIEYHRKVRNKRMSLSVLDDIEGIGPARRKALLEHFRSVDNIRAATPEELEAAPSMNRKAAENVWSFFHQ